jgi:hypothetical protein
MFQTSNRKMAEGLDVNSEVLDRIHEDFKKRLSGERIRSILFRNQKECRGFKGS